MGTYNKALNELFDLWAKACENNPIGNDRYFVRDGLMNKDPKLGIDIEEAWNKAAKRILFIAKDQNQDEDPDKRWDNEDARNWLAIREDVRELQGINHKFWGNVAALLWGLCKTDKKNPWWYGQVMKHYDEMKDFFNTYPFAYIESKKQPGGPTLKPSILKKYLDRDRDFLFKEIDILKPNFIVCYHHLIYSTVLSKYPQDELIGLENDNSIKYHPSTGTFIFCGDHPSSRKSAENIYQSVMHHYRLFIESEPYSCMTK